MMTDPSFFAFFSLNLAIYRVRRRHGIRIVRLNNSVTSLYVRSPFPSQHKNLQGHLVHGLPPLCASDNGNKNPRIDRQATTVPDRLGLNSCLSLPGVDWWIFMNMDSRWRINQRCFFGQRFSDFLFCARCGGHDATRRSTNHYLTAG